MERTEPRQPAARRVIAENLHRAALRLLRRLRRVDESLEVSAARLSALSVLVFAGPQTVSGLARIEQVRQPTMSNLLRGLEADGLVRCRTDPDDRRVRHVEPTAAGRALLARGRRQRVGTLVRWMAALPDRDVRTLARAATLIEGLVED